jgi:hypothetical protein
MSERQVNCFKCGGDGHISRNCPQCIHIPIQPPILATTAENQDTSPEIALRPNKKPTGLPDKTTTTTNAQIPSASTAEDTDTWPVIVEKVTPFII